VTALAVLVLLLFFILLALSLTAWAALSMSTKRRRALADSTTEPHANAGRRVPAATVKGVRTGATRVARTAAPGPQVPEAPSTQPRVRVVAGSGAGGREAKGDTVRPEQKRLIRDPAELPWLKPPGGHEPASDEPGRAKAAKADRGETDRGQRKGRSPRVVATDAEPQRENGSGQAAEQGRATVSLGSVERDAFDRFLDAERRRD